MIDTSKISVVFFMLFFSFLAAGCVSTIQHHGVLIEDKQLAALKVGQSTKRDVQNKLGSPSSVPPFDENTWYYISRVTETVTFFTPTVLESTVYVLTFSPQGILEKIEKVSKDKLEDVSPVKRTTPSVGHSTPIMKRIFRNLGKPPSKPRKAP